jgi:hypothetical protein
VKVLFVAQDFLTEKDAVAYLVDYFKGPLGTLITVRICSPYQNVLEECDEFRPDLVVDMSNDLAWSCKFAMSALVHPSLAHTLVMIDGDVHAILAREHEHNNPKLLWGSWNENLFRPPAPRFRSN